MRPQLRQVPPAVKHGLYITMLLAKGHNVIHIPLHARIGAQVILNIPVCFRYGNADVPASEKAPMPYTMPKFTALARERISGVTNIGGRSNTWEAVTV